MVIEAIIERRHIQGNPGMGCRKRFDTLRCGDEREEANLIVRHASLIEDVDGSDRRVSRGYHGIDDDEEPALDFWELTEVLNGLLRFGVAKHPNMPDTG